MPMYDYQCNTCKTQFEAEIPLKEKIEGVNPACPACGAADAAQVFQAIAYRKSRLKKNPTCGGTCDC